MLKGYYFWKEHVFFYDGNHLFYHDKILEKIGSGEESTSFRFYHETLKIHHSIVYKDHLKKEDAVFLSQLSTKRILLPKDMIFYENGDFFGYSKKWIFENGEELLSLEKKNLLEEISYLLQDVFVLSENGVRMSDLRKENYVFNGKIYNVDPGDFILLKQYQIDLLKTRNIETFQKSLASLFFEKKLKEICFDRTTMLKIYRRLCYEFRHQKDIFTYLEKEPFQDLNEFINQKIRSYHI